MSVRRAAWAFAALGAALAITTTERAFVAECLAGDAKVADTLFKSGKQSFGKGDYADAIKMFKKAQEEDSDLIEASWWCASALEKSGDKPGALAAYREFLTLFDGKNSSSATMSKEEVRLKGLAEKSVDTLAAGEKEFKKLEDAYVVSLLTFAKDNFVRDPGVSLKAVDAVLVVRPDCDDALKLREKLGGAPAPADAKPAVAATSSSAAGPFRDVKEWKDLIGQEAVRAKEYVKYEDGVMITDTKEGAVCISDDYIDVGKSFAYETELHVAQVYDRGWISGIDFASNSGVKSFTCVLISEGRVVLMRDAGGGAQRELASYSMPPLAVDAWHRFGVIVKGPFVDVWFDGKKVASWRDASSADLSGEIGILQQRCRTERRIFHIGKVE